MPSVKRDNSRSSIASITDENEGLIRRTNLQGKTQPSNETVLAAPTTSEPSIEEVKNRMGAALHRIKNRVEELQSPVSGDASGSRASNESESNSEIPVSASAAEGSVAPSTIRALPTDELAKRKAQIVAAARAAEAKAREAEGKFREFETRLEKEIELRQIAETRIAELEKLQHEHRRALESEEKKARQIADVIKELEARIEAEIHHRDEAEKAFLEAQVSASTLKQTLKDYDLKRLSAEEQSQKAAAYAKELEGRALVAEAAMAEAHARLKSVEQEMREIEALVYQSDTNTREMEEKFQAMELRLRQETELRLFAESQLKSLADEVHLQAGECAPDLTQSVPMHTNQISQISQITEKLSHTLAQEIELERKARFEAESARETALQNLHEMETALHRSEQKLKEIETHYESLLRKQQEEFRASNGASNAIASESRAAMSLVPAKHSGQPAKTAPSADRKSKGKMVTPTDSELPAEKSRNIAIYKTAVFLLVLLVVLLCIAAYRQL